jgi:preprotein translocase subunit SecA
LNKEISLKLLPETPEFLTQERAKLWMIEEIKEQLLGAVQAAYKFKMEQVSAYAEQHGIEPFDQAEFERTALLLIIDDQWMEHIDSMDALRHGIGLKAYGQQDPVIAYKKEGFEMFDDMVDRIHEEVVRYVMFAPVAIKVDRNANRPIITSATHGARELAPRKKQPDVKAQEPRRNDPCPCGSGKKYKNCCGSGE